MNHINISLQNILFAIFFLSGTTGLIYEVTWARMLSTVLGSGVLAVSTVTATFMGGLSLGAFFLGRMADRIGNPLAMYACLEAGTGIAAMVLMPVFPLLDKLYASIYGYMDGGLSILAFKGVLSFLVLIIPTFLMGGTLPAMSRFAIKDKAKTGSSVGSLYGINTLGAVAGSLASGFFLIESLGIHGTIRIAALINITLAMISLYLSKREGATRCSHPSSNDRNIVSDVSGTSRTQIGVVSAAYVIAGFTALAYEVIWTRMLSNIFCSTTYAFSTMLATWLTGLALGSLLARKFVDHVKRPVFLFSVLELTIGFCALATIPLFIKLPTMAAALTSSIGPSWCEHMAIKFGISFLVMFVPTLMMGIAFPLVNRICMANIGRTGSTVGRIYTLNTLGCILGSLSAGFLLAILGLQSSTTCMAVLNVVIGLIVMSFSELRGSRNRTGCVIGIALMFATVLWLLPSGMIRTSLARRLERPWGLLYYHEGIDNTTMIFRNENSGVKRMMANFHQYIGDNSRIMTRIQKWQAHLPLLLANAPQRVLLIGGGTGITAGATSLHDLNLTVCEISRGVLEADSFYATENRHVLDNPMINVVNDDGRNYLLQTSEKVDVIIGDLYNAAMSGMVSLYTREYYQICSRHLSENGLMCQWISMKDFPEDALKGVMATFQSVFPHTTLWFAMPDIIAMVGSMEPLHINLRKIDRRMKDPAIKNELKQIGLNSPFLLMGHFLMNESDGRNFAATGKIVTDEHPWIEYAIPRSLHYLYYRRSMAHTLRNVNERRTSTVSPQDKRPGTMERIMDRYYRAKTHVFMGYALYLEGQLEKARSQYREALRINSRDVDAALLLESLPSSVDH